MPTIIPDDQRTATIDRLFALADDLTEQAGKRRADGITNACDLTEAMADFDMIMAMADDMVLRAGRVALGQPIELPPCLAAE